MECKVETLREEKRESVSSEVGGLPQTQTNFFYPFLSKDMYVGTTMLMEEHQLRNRRLTLNEVMSALTKLGKRGNFFKERLEVCPNTLMGIPPHGKKDLSHEL